VRLQASKLEKEGAVIRRRQPGGLLAHLTSLPLDFAQQILLELKQFLKSHQPLFGYRVVLFLFFSFFGPAVVL